MAAAAVDQKALNTALKDELAKLEALERSLAGDSAESKQAKIIADAKASFDHFDKDASGFIDAAELAALAAELGEPLDKGELKQVLAQIDVSGDKKISFSEFLKWWTSDERAANSGVMAKLKKLKGKLGANTTKVIAKALAKAAAEAKFEAIGESNDPKDWLSHRVAFSLGDVGESKASLTVSLKHEDFGQARADVLARIHLRLALNAGYEASDLRQLKDMLSALMDPSSLTDEVVETADGPHWVLSWDAGGADPSAALGINYANVLRDCAFSIDLATPLPAFLGVGEGAEMALGTLAAFKAELNLNLRKALLEQLSRLPGMSSALFTTALRSSNVSLRLNSLAEFVAGITPPEHMTEEIQAQLRLVLLNSSGGVASMAVTQMAGDYGRALSDPAFKESLRGLVRGLLPRKGTAEAGLLATFKSAVKEPLAVNLHLSSGLKITCDFNNFLPISQLLDV